MYDYIYFIAIISERILKSENAYCAFSASYYESPIRFVIRLLFLFCDRKELWFPCKKITSSSRRRFSAAARLQECGDQTREVRTRRVRDVSTKEKTAPSRIRIISKPRVYVRNDRVASRQARLLAGRKTHKHARSACNAPIGVSGRFFPIFVPPLPVTFPNGDCSH